MDSEVLLKVLPLHVSDRNLCGSLSHVANHFRQRIKVLVGVSGNMFKWTALVARHVIVNRAIQTLLIVGHTSGLQNQHRCDCELVFVLLCNGVGKEQVVLYRMHLRIACR